MSYKKARKSGQIKEKIPLGQGQVFNERPGALQQENRSQSLWVRDRFLIRGGAWSLTTTEVAIPLGQGQVFNSSSGRPLWLSCVAIPLGQGQVFNRTRSTSGTAPITSQSLWVRDRFLIYQVAQHCKALGVAIPLGQGQVFNLRVLQSAAGY